MSELRNPNLIDTLYYETFCFNKKTVTEKASDYSNHFVK